MSALRFSFTIIFGLCFGLFSSNWGAVEHSDFLMQRAVLDAQPGLNRVDIDRSIYQNIDQRLSNIRLWDGQQFVPYLIAYDRKLLSKSKHDQVDMMLQPIVPGNPNDIVMIFQRRSSSSHPDQLIVNTTLLDFEQTITVWGKLSRQEWQLVTSTTIFDYSHIMNVRQTSVSLDGPAYDQYKVVISKYLEGHKSPLARLLLEQGLDQRTTQELYEKSLKSIRFNLTSIDFYESIQQRVWGPDLMQEWDNIHPTITHDSSHKQSEIVIQTPPIPVDTIILDASSRFFSRPVSVWGKTKATQSFEHILNTSLQNVSTSDSRIALSFPRYSRYIEYRITIENQDNPPLDIKAVSFKGPIETLFFFQDDRPISLLMGGAAQPIPVYSLSKYITPTAQSQAHRSAWQAAPIENPNFQAALAFNSERVFVGTVIFLVLILCGIVVLSVRKMQR